MADNLNDWFTSVLFSSFFSIGQSLFIV